MTRNRRLVSVVVGLVAVAMVTGACEFDPLRIVDCSDINQPDMGSLICIGRQAFAWQLIGGLITILLGGLGAAL